MAADRDFVVRPFEGLPGEAGLVAMRQLIPAATATLQLNQAAGGGELLVVTVLPDLVRAWRRSDGQPVLAMQPALGANDVSRDLGQAVQAALEAPRGEAVKPAALITSPDSPRLQDLVDPKSKFELTVHDSFGFWADLAEDSDELVKSAEEVAENLDPTVQVPDVEMAFWTDLGGRPFLRWAMGVEEEALLDALARLQAKRQAGVVEEAKYAGAFRALGIVIPVWELPSGTTAADLTEALGTYRQRFDEALASQEPLDGAVRRARAGLVARSFTLR